EHVAWACEPRLVAPADRGAAEADGDGGAVGPVRDLAGSDDGARVLLAGDRYGNVEVDFLAPRQRVGRDWQRRRDRLRGRRVEEFRVQRERGEFETDARHGKSSLSTITLAAPRGPAFPPASPVTCPAARAASSALLFLSRSK